MHKILSHIAHLGMAMVVMQMRDEEVGAKLVGEKMECPLKDEMWLQDWIWHCSGWWMTWRGSWGCTLQYQNECWRPKRSPFLFLIDAYLLSSFSTFRVGGLHHLCLIPFQVGWQQNHVRERKEKNTMRDKKILSFING